MQSQIWNSSWFVRCSLAQEQANECYRDFATSLTTVGDVKNPVLFFLRFGDTLLLTVAYALVPTTGRRSSMICLSNRMARARFHRCGGAAHKTSLRSPSITMCYSNSPPVFWGGGEPIQLTRSLHRRTML